MTVKVVDVLEAMASVGLALLQMLWLCCMCL